MFLLRSFPAIEDVPANREYREHFYARWGVETCIISARARHAEYPAVTQRLSIKSAWGGREFYHMDGRAVAVDDDNYLVINDLRTYGSSLESMAPVHSFSIFFRPGFAEETLGALTVPADRILDSGDDTGKRPVEFAENVRPHDSLVTPLLRYIAAQVDNGLEDDMWYEEQLSFLLERMLRAHRKSLSAANTLGITRESARREVLRRIGWSVDYINSCYDRRLTIRSLARAAALSQFHFIRVFKTLHGVTPFAYLQRKRASVARRLLLENTLSMDEIAARVGLASRSTMYRQLRRLATERPAAPRGATALPSIAGRGYDRH
jgi:AraC-like DNA-binding protein